MLFDATSNKCKCDGTRNFKAAGVDSCVLESDYDQLTRDGFVTNNQNVITYYNVQNSRGSLNTPISINSDVFRSFYVQSAAGCMYQDDR